MKNQLRISEIFYSLQGETSTIGLPTVFVRLTGCPLRCQYCDTAYAFHGGELRSQEAVLETVGSYQPQYVTVTGGEPLAQPAVLPLLSALCNRGYRVSLETSGAMNVALVDPRVVKILDIKTPGSQEMPRNYYANLDHLFPHDEVKFVICDRADFDWALDFLIEHDLLEKNGVLFSPSFGQLEAKILADWILEVRLPIRFQPQLHKLIWGDIKGV